MTRTTRTFGSRLLFSGHAAVAAAAALGGDQHRQSGTDSTVRKRVNASRARLRLSLAGEGYVLLGRAHAASAHAHGRGRAR